MHLASDVCSVCFHHSTTRPYSTQTFQPSPTLASVLICLSSFPSYIVRETLPPTMETSRHKTQLFWPQTISEALLFFFSWRSRDDFRALIAFNLPLTISRLLFTLLLASEVLATFIFVLDFKKFVSILRTTLFGYMTPFSHGLFAKERQYYASA